MFSGKFTRKRYIKNYPETLKKVNREFLPAAGLMVEGEAKTRVPVDEGELRDSIGSRVSGDKVIIGTNVEYAPYVEYGTKPHFPPIGAIQQWARRVIGTDSKSTAFLIARKISRVGTKAHPFLRPALDKNRKNLTKLYLDIFWRFFRGR